MAIGGRRVGNTVVGDRCPGPFAPWFVWWCTALVPPWEPVADTAEFVGKGPAERDPDAATTTGTEGWGPELFVGEFIGFPSTLTSVGSLDTSI